jgi:hypothetical protein
MKNLLSSCAPGPGVSFYIKIKKYFVSFEGKWLLPIDWLIDICVPPTRDFNDTGILFAVDFRNAVVVSYLSGAGLFSVINVGLVWRRVAIENAGKLIFVDWIPKLGRAG